MRRPCDRIPGVLDPAAQFVLERILEAQSRVSQGQPHPLAWWRVEAGAGLGKDTLRSWLYQRDTARGPTIAAVRAALNELGYDLEVVPLNRRQH